MRAKKRNNELAIEHSDEFEDMGYKIIHNYAYWYRVLNRKNGKTIKDGVTKNELEKFIRQTIERRKFLNDLDSWGLSVEDIDKVKKAGYEVKYFWEPIKDKIVYRIINLDNFFIVKDLIDRPEFCEFVYEILKKVKK